MRSLLRLASVIVALLAAPAAAHAAPCANADTVPTAANLSEVRDAVLCLHDQARADHGLPPLRADVKLRRAADQRAGEMVREHYFEHTSPAGVPFYKRIGEAGYAGRDMAENLGMGEQSSAADLMEAWLASPDHRRNLLRARYRDIGVGVHLGTPSDPGQGVTIAVEFGLRLSA